MKNCKKGVVVLNLPRDYLWSVKGTVGILYEKYFKIRLNDIFTKISGIGIL